MCEGGSSSIVVKRVRVARRRRVQVNGREVEVFMTGRYRNSSDRQGSLIGRREIFI